jgi:hypothetical protein
MLLTNRGANPSELLRQGKRIFLKYTGTAAAQRPHRFNAGEGSRTRDPLDLDEVQNPNVLNRRVCSSYG